VTIRWVEGSEASAAPPILARGRREKRFFAPLSAGKQFMRFNVVGAIGIVVQLATLTLLTRGFGLDYLWATGSAASITVLHNFAWHERFTFCDRMHHRAARSASAILARFVKFNLLTGSVSIGGNVFLMHWFRGHARLPLVAANLLVIAICGVFNYVANDQFVFRQNG